MWALGIGFALLFFVLRGVNHWWASLDGPSIVAQYAPIVECPAKSVPVEMRQTGMEGAENGQGKEAHA